MLETDIFQTPLDEVVPPVKDNKDKIDKFDRLYAEETIKIRTTDFGRGILIPKDEKPSLDGKTSFLIGKQGTFTASTLADDLNVRYSVNLNDKYIELNLNYNLDGVGSSYRSQKIQLVAHELYFGTGWSFVCNMCNKPCKTLYLPRKDNFFACRSCKRIVYGLCYLDSKVPHQACLYHLNRVNKAISDYPIFKRIFYGGALTKKAKRLVNMYKKAGLRPSAGVQNIIDMNSAMIEVRQQKEAEVQLV